MMSGLLLFALLTATPGATPAQALPTTLDAVRAAPDIYDGKWVRLRGQVDQCYHFGCALCPEEATPASPQAKRCLALDFDRQRGNPREHGADLDPVYRYATVELVARFDKTCLTGNAICTDRATVLNDARVFQVLKRRTSEEGLNGRRQIDRMVDPPLAAAKPLMALLGRKSPEQSFGPHYRVFADPHDPLIEKSAIVCRSNGKEGELGTWPVDEWSAIFVPSTEDRFKCFFADKVDGRWIINPD